MKSVVILKRSAFGDIVHTLPALAALRRGLPGARITWLTGLGYGSFLRAVEGVDEVHEIGFRRSAGRGGIRDYFHKLGLLRRSSADALVDFQGTLKSWLLISATGATRKIGFHRSDLREHLVGRFYSEQAEKMPEGLHVIEQYLRLLRPLGVDDDEVVFPRINIEPGIAERIDTWFVEQRIDPEKTVVVNPFTAWHTKNWPLEFAAEISKLIRGELGLFPLLLWGPRERAPALQIACESDGMVHPAPPTDKLELTALLRRTALYIGGDTGPTHLSALLGTPTIALFGPTDPRRNGPLNPADKTLRVDLGCGRCKRNRCTRRIEAECMKRLTPSIVFNAVVERLG